MIIGFWKRLLSDCLDSIFLGIFGLILIFPLKLLLGGRSESALWVGLIISFLYGGILQSSMGEGQTLAKRLLHIQVVSLNGKLLSLPLSCLRYSVIAFIFYNGVFGSILGMIFPWPAFSYLFVCFVVILFLGCVLIVPIHPLKRGVHDLIAGSIVVKKGTYKTELKKVEKKERSRVLWAYGSWAAASLLTLAIGGFELTKLWNSPNSFLEAASDVSQAVQENTDYQNVRVTLNTFTTKPFSGTPTTVRRLIISGFLPDSIHDDLSDKENDVEKAVGQVLIHYPHLDQVDKIIIETRTGFSIGIMNFNKTETDEFDTTGHKLNT